MLFKFSPTAPSLSIAFVVLASCSGPSKPSADDAAAVLASEFEDQVNVTDLKVLDGQESAVNEVANYKLWFSCVLKNKSKDGYLWSYKGQHHGEFTLARGTLLMDKRDQGWNGGLFENTLVLSDSDMFVGEWKSIEKDESRTITDVLRISMSFQRNASIYTIDWSSDSGSEWAGDVWIAQRSWTPEVQGTNELSSPRGQYNSIPAKCVYYPDGEYLEFKNMNIDGARRFQRSEKP